MLPHPNTVLAILCRADGTLVEVLHDEFGLEPRWSGNKFLAGIIGAASRQKASRFLRSIAAHGSAVDWQLGAVLPEGEVRLYFTGISTGRGVMILAAIQPLCALAKAPRNGGAMVGEMAAHDLRNPASGILAASEFLIEDAKGSLEDYHLNLLRSIQSSSRLMLRLIDEIMEAPAIEARPPKPAPR